MGPNPQRFKGIWPLCGANNTAEWDSQIKKTSTKYDWAVHVSVTGAAVKRVRGRWGNDRQTGYASRETRDGRWTDADMLVWEGSDAAVW